MNISSSGRNEDTNANARGSNTSVENFGLNQKKTPDHLDSISRRPASIRLKY
ncbi:hypothetical protein [Paenibacillus sp. RC343]|uniref:hypothetical protein n=1 Tax=Paenibacillus sp. RC343 TaxID=3045841 RepID=UPI0024B9C0C7|nr:hypothetical protein [Paenibacillus sp. RC343]